MWRFPFLVALCLLLTSCNFYPHGMSEYSDYIAIRDNLGILMHTEGKAPEMVLSQTVGIEMLVDNRIYGSWSLTEDVESFIIQEDGTFIFIAPSGEKSIETFMWSSGNVFSIIYDDGAFDIFRFDMLDANWAYITIYTSDSNEPLVFIAQRYLSTDYRNTNYNGYNGYKSEGFTSRR